MDIECHDALVVEGKASSRAHRGLIARSRDFRLLWSAHSVSALGDAVTAVALPSVAILTLHAGGVLVGLLTAAWAIAWGAFGLVAGVWTDRLPRRWLMIVCDLARLLLLASVPIAYLAGVLTLSQLLLVAVLGAIANVFFSTASATYVPEILDAADYAEGNARLELSTSTTQFAGPTLAGVLVGLVGAPLALLADALSFLLSAAFLRGIRPRHAPPRESGRARGGFRRELGAGLRAIRERPILMFITCSAGISNIGLSASQAVLLLFIYRGLGLAPQLAGIALGLGAAGNVVGALVAPRLGRRLGQGRLLLIATTIEGIALLPIELALIGLPVFWVAFALAARGFFNPLWNVNVVTVRQVIVPLELQGRVVAVLRVIGYGLAPLGAIAGGALGQVLASKFGPATGYGVTLAITSVVAGASGLALIARRVRELRL